ncbi:M28 family peptidase [Robertkochia aurantiaca]|uniref:M28 family peptidase n=1 Tax=Robertkochia aurantiaca TaxID=2873700 RepID=UPI001CCD37DF|nr:M28 family peptidase [Robertkochia sp. 3YJGBD-33]
MKRIAAAATLLLLILAVIWRFQKLTPNPDDPSVQIPAESFSNTRAFDHVRAMSVAPHYVGSRAHDSVRNYIIGELKAMGLQVETQEGYTAGDWGSLSKAVNIIATIEGSDDSREEALVLMSHYDSQPHSSHGAGDAASGVAVILEGIRAYLAQGNIPENDVIILITDAEELGLNGAELFVKKHELRQKAALVLNFEARGSGGPGYMLIETNGGNAKLIESFSDANPTHPVANSLAYSIYKLLPNDTDLTVFREDGNIDGFNFAFIDDHFDYHTALDRVERLDPATLQHQASYLMPLLYYFAQADLGNLSSSGDHVYFDFPFYRLVFFPFSWIWPMILGLFIVFLSVTIYGFSSNKLILKDIGKGSLPLLISLTVVGITGYLLWPLLLWLYPGYRDMLHGFTYNGHDYIAFIAAFALAICFYTYARFRKIPAPALLFFPLLLWFALCIILAVYLPGAGFFVIPALGTVAAYFIYLRQEKPSLFLMLFLALPAIWILGPFVKMFPIGLGLKILVASGIFTVLIFSLCLPLLLRYRWKKTLAFLFAIVAAFSFISAHFDAAFTPERPRPTSLVYLHDADSNESIWATYNKEPDEWVKGFIPTKNNKPDEGQNFSSKYGSSFTFTAPATSISLMPPDISIKKDTLISGLRHLELCVVPHRDVNRLEVLAPGLQIHSLRTNGVAYDEGYLHQRRERLFTHFITQNDYTTIEMVIDPEAEAELIFYESSYDLLRHEDLSVPERPGNSIPMPFVLNDAIIVKKKISL